MARAGTQANQDRAKPRRSEATSRGGSAGAPMWVRIRHGAGLGDEGDNRHARGVVGADEQ
jgi:hypothetical protein